MKESFVFYASFYKAIDLLKDKSKLNLYDAICKYQLYGLEPVNLSNEEQAIFILIRFIIDNYSILSSKDVRVSPAYKVWRLEVLKRDNFTCQACGDSNNLHAHHIIRFVDDKDERFNVDNGITLCEKCHRKIHSKGGLDGR